MSNGAQGAAGGQACAVRKAGGAARAEIGALIEARDQTGLFATEAFMIVHHPQWQTARRWIEAGEIGTLHHVDAQFSFQLTDPGNIRNRPETGGGSLPDIGVYTFGAARWVTGPSRLT